MTGSASPPIRSWHTSRYGFAAFYFLFLLAIWFLLRVVLFAAFRPANAPLADAALAFLDGFRRDFFAALVEVIPLLLWLLVVPEGWFRARWHRMLFWIATFVAFYTQIFLLFVEFFFFEEFKSRFNTVAVDYLLFPYEVFVNIWDSYHVGIFVTICAVLSPRLRLCCVEAFFGDVGTPLHGAIPLGLSGFRHRAGRRPGFDLEPQRRSHQR